MNNLISHVDENKEANMKTVTNTIRVYTFAELSAEIQDNVLEDNRDALVIHPEWSSHVIEDFTENIAPLFGLSDVEVYFSGFSSQGDGACFEAGFEYAKNMTKNVQTFAPNDRVLHKIARNLQYTQRKTFYRLHGSVSHRGSYVHSGCTEFDVYLGDEYAPDVETDDIKILYRELMNWLYDRLENEYDFLTSEAALREHFTENEYEFTETGEVY